MKQLEMMMSTKINGSVNAVYRETDVLSYQGNPLIECLPKLENLEEVISRIDQLPTKVLRSGQPQIRAHELTNALSNAFVALPQHYELAVYIDMKLKQGYCSRNPNLKLSPQLLQSNYEKMINEEIVSDILNVKQTSSNIKQTSSQTSGIIYGIAGSGKTTSFERVLSYYPQVINHEALGITQVTYLRINFPHDARPETLCYNFFYALNEAINQPNHNWLVGRVNLTSMLAQMRAAIIRLNIGILVIDDFQIWRKNSKDSAGVIGYLDSLINSVKIPIIFSGTPDARGRFESNVASSIRVIGFDTWDPLEAHSFESHRVEKSKLWDYFVQKLWPYQYLSKPPADLTKEINKVWFDCSQGIIDIAVKLFIQVQLRAIYSKTEIITPELFQRVYEDDFKSVHSIIDALRSGNLERVAMQTDLPQSAIAATIASLISSIEKANKKSTISHLTPIAQEVLDLLIQLGYEKDVAQPAVEAIFSGNASLDKKDLLILAIDLLAEKNEEKPQTKPKRVAKKTKPTPPDIITAQAGSLFDDIVNK